jgi:hypothetical protein
MDSYKKISMHILNSDYDAAWRIVEEHQHYNTKKTIMDEDFIKAIPPNPSIDLVFELITSVKGGSYTFYCVKEDNNIAVVSNYFDTFYDVDDIVAWSARSSKKIIVIEDTENELKIYFINKRKLITLFQKNNEHAEFDSEKLSNLFNIDKTKTDFLRSDDREEILKNISALFKINLNIGMQGILEGNYQYEDFTYII